MADQPSMDPTAAVLNTIEEGIKTLSVNQKHLMEQFQVLNENQKAVFDYLKGMNTNLQNAMPSHQTLQGIEVDNGVDCYPFRDQFERLCQDVADLKKQEGFN